MFDIRIPRGRTRALALAGLVAGLAGLPGASAVAQDAPGAPTIVRCTGPNANLYGIAGDLAPYFVYSDVRGSYTNPPCGSSPWLYFTNPTYPDPDGLGTTDVTLTLRRGGPSGATLNSTGTVPLASGDEPVTATWTSAGPPSTTRYQSSITDSEGRTCTGQSVLTEWPNATATLTFQGTTHVWSTDAAFGQESTTYICR